MSDPLRVQMSGPLSVFAAGFLEQLLGRGYRPGTAAKQLQLMAHLSRWMAERDLEPGALRGVEIERFVQDRRASGRVQLASARALVPLLRYLRDVAGAPAAASREAPTAAGALVERYADYLLVQRRLAAETVRGYCNTARAFLADRERVVGDLALGALDVAAINDYLLGRSRRGSITSSMAVVTGLRSLLRFLHVEGLIDRDLAVAVAPVANWRLASLVRALDASSVARLLVSCDRGAAVGRRDFAILLLLSRLGLRIGEVAALRLDDLDWRAGELVVCGKGSRRERLPLPVDVGEAVAAWLKDGRPVCQSRFVFTRARAPHDGLHPSALTSVVHRACCRAGLPRVGAHRLRHTAATEMLRAGGSPARGRAGAAPSQQRGHLDLRQGRPPRAARGRAAVAGSGSMTSLAHHLEDYLAIRRSLGFKLTSEHRLLCEFAAFMDAAGASTVTIELALRWATTPTGVGHAYLAQRMRAVRGFARYLHGIDPATEIPPLELLPARRHRPTPHIYSEAETAVLMTAAHTLRPALRAATMETLIGLLACTGLRVGEAFALDRADIDTDNRLLRIRDSKFGKSREVLIHDSTLAALNAYLERRDQLRPGGDRVCVFVSSWGARLNHNATQRAFDQIRRAAGVTGSSPGRWPRAHDPDFRSSWRFRVRRAAGNVVLMRVLGSVRAAEVDFA